MFEISDEKYEELRIILEKQNGRAYALEEAQEVGNELVDFYRLLLQLNDREDAGEDTVAAAAKPEAA